MLKPQSFNYWQYKIQQNTIDEVLFSDYGYTYEKTSKFVYLAFVDKEKDTFRCGWSMHKDHFNLIGFLEHVFIPTAFFNWYDTQSDGFFMPVSNFDIVREQIGGFEIGTTDDFMFKMRRELKSMYHNTFNEKLDAICHAFNRKFNQKNKRIYIKTFNDIQALKDEILAQISFDELFFEEMEMSVGDFEHLCSNIENEDFFKKRIITYLNTHIPIMF